MKPLMQRILLGESLTLEERNFLIGLVIAEQNRKGKGRPRSTRKYCSALEYCLPDALYPGERPKHKKEVARRYWYGSTPKQIEKNAKDLRGQIDTLFADPNYDKAAQLKLLQEHGHENVKFWEKLQRAGGVLTG